MTINGVNRHTLLCPSWGLSGGTLQGEFRVSTLPAFHLPPALYSTVPLLLPFLANI